MYNKPHLNEMILSMSVGFNSSIILYRLVVTLLLTADFFIRKVSQKSVALKKFVRKICIVIQNFVAKL